MTHTLARYFGFNFLRAVAAVFVGVFVLVALVDYIELLRHSARQPNASALLVLQTSLFRVPQLTERIMPFAVLIGAMSSFLSLSRRNELVVARAAGMSAWQFVFPAATVAIVLGLLAATIYNPIAASLNERSKQLEAQMSGDRVQSGLQFTPTGFWMRQKSSDGQAIIHALGSRDEGLRLDGVTVFAFDDKGIYQRRISARTATLKDGHWLLEQARIYSSEGPPTPRATYELKTNITTAEVRETFATPESVPFWNLPGRIESAERAGIIAKGYRLQYQKLLARPILLAGMIFVAAAFSLRFFRFGGVQKMIVGGIVSGFVLYVFSKTMDDLSIAEVIWPVAAAWFPAIAGVLIGMIALLYLEDG